MLPERAVVVATQRQVACDVGGESVILQLDDGVYYGLNAVGSRVWHMIQEPKSVGDIVAAIVEEFDVARDRCEADVGELIDSLLLRRLARVWEEERS